MPYTDINYFNRNGPFSCNMRLISGTDMLMAASSSAMASSASVFTYVGLRGFVWVEDGISG